MADSKIEWTDVTWNPLRARNKETGKVGHYCELVSPGCAHCYASAFQPRFGLPQYAGHPQRAGRHAELDLFLDEKTLKAPLSWKAEKKVFVCSMTDLFLDAYPDEWLNRVFAVMALTPQHTYQVLTKRPERMRDYLNGLSSSYDRLENAARSVGYTLRFQGLPLLAWPIPNVWAGVSLEDQQRADERIPHLLQTPAAVRFLSVEPLLGPIEFEPNVHNLYGGIHWCIIGGESGPNARPCHLNWIRSIVEQCREALVEVFVKQLGSLPLFDRDESTLYLRDKKGGSMDEWPEGLRIRQFPEVRHAE